MKKLKYIKMYEYFLNKFRSDDAGLDLIPKETEEYISGEIVGRVENLTDLDGKTLYDHDMDLMLFIDASSNYMELIDPHGNNESGKVIQSYYIPKIGETIGEYDSDNLEDDDYMKNGVYYSTDYELEFIKNNKTFSSFSIKNSEDVTNLF